MKMRMRRKKAVKINNFNKIIFFHTLREYFLKLVRNLNESLELYNKIFKVFFKIVLRYKIESVYNLSFVFMILKILIYYRVKAIFFKRTKVLI